MSIPIASRQKWLKYEAPTNRNVEHLVPNFFTIEAAETQRRTCAAILSNGDEVDLELAERLSAVEPGELADTFCCPLVARKFQTFFVSRVLKVVSEFDGAVLLSLFDPEDAVREGKLDAIDWRKLHARLRKRIERCLGPSVIVVGMGEVEYDDTMRVWQPHHHLALFGATEEGLSVLRRSHYRAMRGEVRPMVRSAETTLAGWLSYMAKQVAFRKLQTSTGGGPRRVRLKPTQLREFMRYAAERNPSTFVFTLNCSVIKSSTTRRVAVDKNVSRRRRILRKRS